MTVTVGGIQFSSKAEAELRIREILGRHSQMQPLAGDDLRFVIAILELHPNRDTIVDCGVRRIVVQHLKDKYDSRRFVVVRTDSSIRDFTWRVALYPKTARMRVMNACRFAIKDQIREFRARSFSEHEHQVCVVSGMTISAFDSDVDHIPPRTFQALVETWLRLNRIDAESVALVPVVGYEKPDRWEDLFLEENWKEYHRTHAHLRVVHSWANRSIIRKAANGPSHD